MDTYTIGQIAERSGFSTSALRYYERHGLMEPAGRTEAGYRLYDDGSLARLQFIARAKQLGCTLDEITALARLWDGDDCGPVQRRLHELVTTKISEAQARSAELVQFTAQLQSAASRLGAEPVDGPCDAGCACLDDASRASGLEGPVPVSLGPSADPVIACTLTADEIPERMQEWRAVLGNVVRRSALDDGGVRLTLAPDVPLDEVVRLAAAEQGCCSFFAFAVTVDHRGIALEVRAPDEAGDLVAAVFGSAA